ncbi:MAG: hypothetical protein KA807_15595 [Prolixibacteraceae bacterium]|nr:hypothetical protein [Prolixibacteraceae bacterium]
MIEMIGDLIMGIIGLIKKGEFTKASVEIENAFHEFLKEDAAFFFAIPKEKITETLLNEHNYTHGHLEILSELMFAQSELSFAKNNYAECLEFTEKALILTEYVINTSDTYSADKESRVELLKERVESLNNLK